MYRHICVLFYIDIIIILYSNIILYHSDNFHYTIILYTIYRFIDKGTCSPDLFVKLSFDQFVSLQCGLSVRNRDRRKRRRMGSVRSATYVAKRSSVLVAPCRRNAPEGVISFYVMAREFLTRRSLADMIADR